MVTTNYSPSKSRSSLQASQSIVVVVVVVFVVREARS